METPFAPVEVFCSFADADAPLLEQLEHHLSVLRHEGQITTWHTRQIAAGQDWQKELDQHLNTASLILLLISPDFLASDYQYGVELQQAIQRHNENEARVIPILLRPCEWKRAPFKTLQVIPRNRKPLTLWRNRDAGFAEIAKEIRTTLKTMHRLAINAPSTPLPKIWQIPFARNPFFTGREQMLEQLHMQLQATQAIAISQPQAISGLGGIGKTQLAIEYAYRYRQEYQAVLWARAETTEALKASYIEIARLLNLPQLKQKDKIIRDLLKQLDQEHRQADFQEAQNGVRAVKAWLRGKGGWLLILDNADDLNMVQTFLPTECPGHLLLTTRTQATGKLARRLEVDTLKRDVGALLLLRRARLITQDALLDAASASDQSMALALTEELGGLPLALDQAGAYIEETQCSLADYHRQYQTRRADFLARRGMLVDDHPEPVATTWSLSFAKVEEANPTAAELLRICAFLAPGAILEELVVKALKASQPASEETELEGDGEVRFSRITSGSRDKQKLTSSAKAREQIDEAVASLRAYSLISRNAQTQALTVHRLVQAVLRDSMPPETQRQWKQRVVQVIRTASPDVQDVEQWDACEQWVPHVLVCATWIQEERLDSEENASLLNRAAYYLDDRARYSEAKPLYLLALAIYERLYGVEHPTIASCCTNLALLHENQERYNEAEPLLKRALTICESWLEAEYPDTPLTLMDQAVLSMKQRKYAEAKPLLKRALAIREQELGAMYPDTAQSLNNLGSLFMNQEQYDEAEPLYLHALKICEQWLEAEYPDTPLPLIDEAVLALNNLGILALNNLALLYWKQRKYAEAEPLYLRALKICEQRLEADHLNTALILNNLGSLYVKQRKYAKAKSLLKRALAIREQKLGPEHPNTAQTLNNLSSLSMKQRKYAEAKPLLKRALAIYKQWLGSEHPTTQHVFKNYTLLLQKMEGNGEAEDQEEES